MNSIYFEILDHLFNYLDLKTKLKCRLINKHWLYLIDHYLRLKTIIFFNDVYYDRDQFNKLETNQVINNLNLILNKNLNSIIHKLDLDKFNYFNSNKIKELGLYYLNCLNIEKLLNKFNKIIKLNIGFMIDCDDNLINELNLELLNIEKLSLILVRNKKYRIICNLPKLSYLKIDSDEQIQLVIKYPQSIEYFDINFTYNPKELINLKYLYLNSLSLTDDGKNSLNSIINLKKLKEIHLNNYLMTKFFYDHKLNENVKIFFIGINFDRPNHILKFKFDNIYKFYFNNYNRLEDRISFFNSILYDRLKSFANDNHDYRLLKEFIKKFNFNQITVKETIDDEDKFLNFIKDCNYFKSLLIYPIISSDLIRKLTKICPFIIDLTIGNQIKINSNYNENELKQIIEFKQLKNLVIAQPLSIELIDLFFNQLKHLKFMETRENYYSYSNIKILDVNHFVYTKYNIKVSNNEDVWHFKDWQSLINFIQSEESITFQLKYNKSKSQLEYYSD